MHLLPDGTTAAPPFTLEATDALAKEEEDFRVETSMVSFQAGQSETEVILVILDDAEPEGQEVFFVYLSDPEGGAQITDSPNQGFGAFAKITILGIPLLPPHLIEYDSPQYQLKKCSIVKFKFHSLRACATECLTLQILFFSYIFFHIFVLRS